MYDGSSNWEQVCAIGLRAAPSSALKDTCIESLVRTELPVANLKNCFASSSFHQHIAVGSQECVPHLDCQKLAP